MAGRKARKKSDRKNSGRRSEPRVRACSSPIHGKGLFATRRIRADGYIATFEGKRTKRDGEHVLWTFDDEGNEYGIRGQNDLRFLNHSRHPNADLHGLDLFALRNIQPGAEVTIHYGDAWEDVD